MATVPAWAHSVIDNYRFLFLQEYKRHTRLTDAAIWGIFNSVHNDEDTKQQDADRVEAMLSAET